MERLTPAEYHALTSAEKRGRYGSNKRIITEEGAFDSKGEYARWSVLKTLAAKGEISNLDRQIPFPFSYGGHLIATYNADFVYTVGGHHMVEDWKGGFITPEFKLKAKMMQAFYGITVKIVKKANAEVGP